MRIAGDADQACPGRENLGFGEFQAGFLAAGDAETIVAAEAEIGEERAALTSWSWMKSLSAKYRYGPETTRLGTIRRLLAAQDTRVGRRNMITIEHDREHYLVCRASGTLTKADYDAAVPEIENALQVGSAPPRLMIVLEDFHGWDIAGLWEDLKFDFRHRGDFGRIAVLGDSTLEEWGTRLSRPFFGAEVRFFDIGDRDKAGKWLQAGPGPVVGKPAAGS